MVHCNPAPPHPPPGELYNVICIGAPYIDGVPVGYVVFAGVFVGGLAFSIWLQSLDKSTNSFND